MRYFKVYFFTRYSEFRILHKTCNVIYLQKDVVAESAEILQLGLLFGEDIQATTEDLPAVLSFQHKLLQEYLAAVYIAENLKLDTTSTFLTEAVQTWEKIETHREVLQFACGILVKTNASSDCITNHVAKVLAQHVNDEVNNGKVLPELAVLISCQKEGQVSALNPYLSRYPTCGCPLAEVLASTELAYITDTDSNDTLQLSSSTAQIILDFDEEVRYSETDSDSEVDIEEFDRLWHALQSVQADVIALHLDQVKSANVTKLSHLSGLQYLHIEYCDCSEAAGEELAQSINSWGPQPQLTFCELRWMPIPRSLMTALSKCTLLKHLDIWQFDLSDKLSILMASPPPALRDLVLYQCSLQAVDINHMTQAIREGRLPHLQGINISDNPIGEDAVGSLLETFISSKPQKQLELGLASTGVDEGGKLTELSRQLKTEWKTKLAGTNITVRYSMVDGLEDAI